MYIQSTFSSEFYLQHQEYFDSRLIKLLEQQASKITDLNRSFKIYEATSISNSKQIKDLMFINNDMKITIYNLNHKLKDKEMEIADLLKEFEKTIKKQEKTINHDLNDSYKENTKLHNENERLKEEIARLKSENKKYKRMNDKNSSNSSIPPSMDEFRKVANSRTKSNQKRGGQKGHPLHRSKMSEQPNHIVYKTVAKAPIGAEAILNAHNKVLYYRTQEINAYLKTEVTETRYLVEPSAQELTTQELNKYKINCTTYHDEFKALILYLNSKGTIALDRMCTMINEMSMGEIKLKPSTVVNWQKEFHKKCKIYNDDILEKLKKEHILHVDETGWKINGHRAWLHVIASEHGAYFVVTDKRKDIEVGPLGILTDYDGCLIHDHYKSYYDLEKCTHGECAAHIIRYLKEGAELDKNEACAKLLELFRHMIHEKKENINQGILKMDEKQIIKYEEEYTDIINNELVKYEREHPKKVKACYVPSYIKLMRRMLEYKEEHLRFIKDFTVPADNNLAERQMRPTKAKKKISGQSLSLETANNFAAIHTVIQTCSLQNKNTLEEIKTILKS